MSTVADIRNLVGDRYSPNLRKWLKSNRRSHLEASVFQWNDGGLYIGVMESDDGWFTGSKLWAVLNGGRGSQQTWAHPPEWASHLKEIPDFWSKYAAIGRCAIDPEHARVWIGEETRWKVDGDVRECLWCGNHKQTFRRWTKNVDCSAWENVA